MDDDTDSILRARDSVTGQVDSLRNLVESLERFETKADSHDDDASTIVRRFEDSLGRSDTETPSTAPRRDSFCWSALTLVFAVVIASVLVDIFRNDLTQPGFS